MFHEISERLVTWAAAVAGAPIATLGHPASEIGTPRISLSLIDVIPHLPFAAAPVHRFEASLRYLATVAAETPAEVHRLLGLLAFAAMSRPDFAVDADRPSMQFWLALGVAPRPCISFRVTARKEFATDCVDPSPADVVDRRRGAGFHPKNGCAFIGAPATGVRHGRASRNSELRRPRGGIDADQTV